MSALATWLTHPALIRVCRIVTGLIFLAAGLVKIGDMDAFALAIHNFRIVPVALENVLAITLPWIEVVVALALILGIRARAGAYIATLLLAIFTAAVLQAVLRDISISCGCFGKEGAATTGWLKILENTGMLAVSLVACLRRGVRLQV